MITISGFHCIIILFFKIGHMVIGDDCTCKKVNIMTSFVLKWLVLCLSLYLLIALGSKTISIIVYFFAMPFFKYSYVFVNNSFLSVKTIAVVVIKWTRNVWKPFVWNFTIIKLAICVEWLFFTNSKLCCLLS